MLRYAITFFIISILAGLFGLWGVAGLATEIAKVLCLFFVALLIFSLLSGSRSRPRI